MTASTKLIFTRELVLLRRGTEADRLLLYSIALHGVYLAFVCAFKAGSWES